MKNNIDHYMAEIDFSRTGRSTAVEPSQIPTINPPDRQFGWFSSYDEEWIAFVQEHSIHRSDNRFDPTDPDLRPRVWNCPLA